MVSKALLSLACVAGCALADVAVVHPAADSTIYDAAPDQVSNSRGQFLFAGMNGGGAARRALLRFDVAAAIPTGAEVTEAHLVLTVTRQAGNAGSTALHRCLTPWAEGVSQALGQEGGGAAAGAGDPSWKYSSFDTDQWIHQGGDFAASASDTQSAFGVATVTFGGAGVANDVAAWLAAPAGNFGWILLGEESVAGTATRFGARENSDVNSQPMLFITYSAACAADINHDLTIDFFDYLDFVDAFSAGAVEADFNHDATIDFFDYLDFVDAFSQGCG